MEKTVKSKIFLFASALSLLLVVSITLLSMMNYRPDFVDNAQIRLGSYLTSVYDTTECSSTEHNELEWEITCISDGFKPQKFSFIVYSAEEEKGYKGAFRLVSLNESAKLISKEGIMVYLDVQES